MFRLRCPALLFVALLAGPSLSCAASPTGADAAPRAVMSNAPEVSAAADLELRSGLAALERARAAPGEVRLRLRARSWLENGFMSVELFGSGVGIWNGKAVFAVSAEELAAHLSRLESSGFLSMPPVFGGRPDPRSGRPRMDRSGAGDGPGQAGPIRIVRELELVIGGPEGGSEGSPGERLEKRVEQQTEGEQSEALEKLVVGLLEACRERGEAGTRAPDLTAGLEMMANGELPAEPLRLQLHDKPELGSSGSGFLMEVYGGSLTVRAYAPGAGYGEPRSRELDDGALRALAGAIARHRPGRFPVNLHSERYVDLTIEVLEHRMSTQARRFARLDATSHGALQDDFDALLEVLRGLAAGTAPE